jgi:hypothetical protein
LSAPGSIGLERSRSIGELLSARDDLAEPLAFLASAIFFLPLEVASPALIVIGVRWLLAGRLILRATADSTEPRVSASVRAMYGGIPLP